MNPNHFLAVAIEYLFTHRPGWSKDAAVGKTLVSSALIDRVVASMGRELIEVPVGFKYFVPGLLSGAVGFGGRGERGSSFLRKDGTVWSTDKGRHHPGAARSEILAVTGKTPSQLHEEQVERFGASAYARIDAAASREEKAKLAALSPEDVTATELAGDPIVAKLVRAPGNDAPIGGLKGDDRVRMVRGSPVGHPRTSTRSTRSPSRVPSTWPRSRRRQAGRVRRPERLNTLTRPA